MSDRLRDVRRVTKNRASRCTLGSLLASIKNARQLVSRKNVSILILRRVASVTALAQADYEVYAHCVSRAGSGRSARY